MVLKNATTITIEKPVKKMLQNKKLKTESWSKFFRRVFHDDNA
jgi:predicted CopG family antitoxin